MPLELTAPLPLTLMLAALVPALAALVPAFPALVLSIVAPRGGRHAEHGDHRDHSESESFAKAGMHRVALPAGRARHALLL